MIPKFHGKMRRVDILQQIDYAFEVNHIVALLGPRQSGKTTTAKQYIKARGSVPKQNYLDLENPRDVQRLSDPMLTLSALSGLIVIDEIQFVPELFSTLRVLIDDEQLDQQYLILGSASGELMRQSSESLAGRITYVELMPFSLSEVKGDQTQLWSRGGFPKSYLAKTDDHSQAWRKSFIRTFLETDIPKLGINIPSENLRRFWMMIAHYHGAILNTSEIASSLGITNKTVRRYADILTETFMLRQLQPWHANIGKRQVKSPKIYLRDSGILHSLWGVDGYEDLLLYPKLGASWEGFALEEITRIHKAEPGDCYFWATHQAAELDLLLLLNGKRHGFEFKYHSSPKLTKSMRIAQEDLSLDSLTVIYPGDIEYPLAEGINAMGLSCYLQNQSKTE